MAGAAQFGGTGLQAILALNEWLGYQLGNWQDWAREREAGWLALATGNAQFPTIGHFFRHAFSPLHRYADQAAGQDAADDSAVDPADWAALTAWAWQCLERHHDLLLEFEPGWLDRDMRFKTRSAGLLETTVGGALAHAATHAVWHLGGITHLLRSQGITPPQRSDMILWLSHQLKEAETD